MKTLLCRSLLFFGIISTFSSCQTSHLATSAQARLSRRATASREVLLHDSQGPQATRVTMTAAEAAAFRQQ